MTEKRFYIDTIDGGESVLTDNGKELSLYGTCNLLNELNDENEKLKNKLKFFMELNKPYGDIIKENEQLKIKLIYNFIKNNIMPKYNVLCSCKVQDNEFYIEYDEFLSFDERNILNREILQQIYDFCVSSDIGEYCFFNISVFLVIKVEEGDF